MEHEFLVRTKSQRGDGNRFDGDIAGNVFEECRGEVYVERVERVKAEWRIRNVVDDVVVVRGGMSDRPELREHGAEGDVVGAFGDAFCHSKVAKDDGAAASDRQRRCST